MKPRPPVTPDGTALSHLGWTGKHSAIRRAVRNGCSLVVRDPLGDAWVEDPDAWWSEHGDQVVTDDHQAAEPWPETAYFVPTFWRSGDTRVVLMEENC